jgi:ribosomal protein S18 acetylase RimI-like enzyme
MNQYSILTRVPTIDEYMHLRAVTGLSGYTLEAAEAGLKGTVFSAVIAHQDKIVGMGRLIGDGGCFFQVVDIAVEPDHQGKGLGKMIMTVLMDYVERELPSSAYVSLIADVPANKLYQKFGFVETAPRSLDMAFRKV